MRDAERCQARWSGKEKAIAEILAAIRGRTDWTKSSPWQGPEGNRFEGGRDGPLFVRDLRGISIASVNVGDSDGLADTDLRWAVFRNVDCSGASFVGSRLGGAVFEANCVLDRARFDHAELMGTRFNGVSVREASFHGADLRGADFEGADLRGALFKEVTWSMEHATGMLLGTEKSTRFGGRYQCGAQLGADSDIELCEYVDEESARCRFQRRSRGVAWLWYVTTNHGRSPARLLGWVLMVWLAFGMAYTRLPLPRVLEGSKLGAMFCSVGPEFVRGSGPAFSKWWEPFYFSGVVLTTVGLGDIAPAPGDWLGQVLVITEPAIGIVLFGLFVTLLLRAVIR